jgi:hypothetical protein
MTHRGGSTYGGVEEGKVIRKGGRLTSLGMESGGERLFGGGLFIKRRVVEGTCRRRTRFLGSAAVDHACLTLDRFTRPEQARLLTPE